ncbi:C4-dicarboxylate TRAP transporter substrate-binding protein [Tistrella mobilis]|uniref:C4-dicarboxylate TRAP transporter substrate-binding protein n=1 Tax=Tistrella mobilis TaxID=171437 RepID=UPI003556C8DF
MTITAPARGLRRGLTAALAVMGLGALVLPVAPATAAETIPITVTAGHPPAFLWVKTLSETFIPGVNKRLKDGGDQYRIEWTEAYGGTVAKIGSELEAIEEGISDMGFVGTLFEAAKMPLHNVTYMVPFTTDNLFLVTQTVTAVSKRVPEMDQEWSRYGQIPLAGASLDSYHLFTNFPVKSIDDLKGRKIAAPGPAANWLKGTGAVAVAGNLQTYYNDIKTGVYEGTLTFATAAAAAKLHEVAPYITKVNIGAQFAGALSVNADVWADLPQPVKDAMTAEAAIYADTFAKAQVARVNASFKTMQDGGATITELSPAERKRWADALPNVSKEWADELEGKGVPAKAVVQGYLDGLRAAGVQLPRNWDRE